MFVVFCLVGFCFHFLAARKAPSLIPSLSNSPSPLKPRPLPLVQAITTELESKEELIEEMMRESEQLLALADTDQLYVVPADLGDKVTSFKADWKVFLSFIPRDFVIQ